MRRKRSAKRADMSHLDNHVAGTGERHFAIGLVTDEDGDHYERTEGDILVDVALMPNGQVVACRLGGGAPGRKGDGGWSIPDVGTEVFVGIPGGDPSNGGVIIGALASLSIPDLLTAAQLVLNYAEIIIGAPVPGMVPLTHGIVTASGVDPFTGKTYGVLGNASTKHMVEK